MKKTLLYFEELECPLSKTLFAREDLNIIILRTTKNLKFFSKEYLEQTKKYDVFVANAEINESIIVSKEIARKAPESSFIKRLVLGKNKKKNNN